MGDLVYWLGETADTVFYCWIYFEGTGDNERFPFLWKIWIKDMNRYINQTGFSSLEKTWITSGKWLRSKTNWGNVDGVWLRENFFWSQGKFILASHMLCLPYDPCFKGVSTLTCFEVWFADWSWCVCVFYIFICEFEKYWRVITLKIYSYVCMKA